MSTSSILMLKAHELALVGMFFGITGLVSVLFLNMVQAVGFAIIASVFFGSYLITRNEENDRLIQQSTPHFARVGGETSHFSPFPPQPDQSTAPGAQMQPGQQLPGQQLPGQQLPGQQLPGQQQPAQPQPGQQQPRQPAPQPQAFGPMSVHHPGAGHQENPRPSVMQVTESPQDYSQLERMQMAKTHRPETEPSNLLVEGLEPATTQVQSAEPEPAPQPPLVERKSIAHQIPEGEPNYLQRVQQFLEQTQTQEVPVALSPSPPPPVEVEKVDIQPIKHALPFRHGHVLGKVMPPSVQQTTASTAATNTAQGGVVTSPHPYRRRLHSCWKCKESMYIYTWTGHHMWSMETPPVPKPESIQYRFYQTIGTEYWANVCQKCDAVQGDHLVFDTHAPSNWEGF